MPDNQEQVISILNFVYRVGACVELAKQGQTSVITYSDCKITIAPPDRPAQNENSSQLDVPRGTIAYSEGKLPDGSRS